MRRISIKGGYGEHGRSCFMVEYGTEGRCYIVDCGIMDTDPVPWPAVTPEELAQADFLFLTHCHKDHAGAFGYFAEQGFRGWLVTSQVTLRLSGIAYNKILILDETEDNREGEGKSLADIGYKTVRVNYGRSGHCPGGLWFLIKDELGACFFSGDYQEDTVFYLCDPVRNREVQLAIIDCAHESTGLGAKKLRQALIRRVREKLETGRRVILPVPLYGRGLELLYLLKSELPYAVIRVDETFMKCANETLGDIWWYKKESLDMLRDITQQQICRKEAESGFNILLIADTHLKNEKNEADVQAMVSEGDVVLVTGRVREGGAVQRLLNEGKAEKYMFPHHQSRGDFERIIKGNSFGTILPFHNGVCELVVSDNS